MTRTKWKLTQPVDARPEVDEWGDGPYRFGYSLLRMLADIPDSGFEEIAPGVYRGPKLV